MDYGNIVATLVLAVTVLGVYLRQSREAHDREVRIAERMTRLEARVDTLFHFWEKTMERRSQQDQGKWLAARAGGEANVAL